MTDDDLLSPEVLENFCVALKAEEVRTMCRSRMGKAFSCLVELAATEQDPKLRRKASALLESWLREAGLDIVRRSAEQPDAKQI